MSEFSSVSSSSLLSPAVIEDGHRDVGAGLASAGRVLFVLLDDAGVITFCEREAGAWCPILPGRRRRPTRSVVVVDRHGRLTDAVHADAAAGRPDRAADAAVHLQSQKSFCTLHTVFTCFGLQVKCPCHLTTV